MNAQVLHRRHGVTGAKRVGTALLAMALTLSWFSAVVAQDASPVAVPEASGFLTAERPYLVATDPATIEVVPILTAGDMVGDYQVAGAPSGLGGFSEGQNVFMYVTHSLSAQGAKNLSASRVAELQLDKLTGAVKSGSYIIDGSEGYEMLGATVKASEKTGLGTPLVLIGEGSTKGTKGGIIVAYEPSVDKLTELPWLGHMMHLGITVVPGFSGKLVTLLSDASPDASYLYIFVSDTREAMLAGDGQLYVFAAEGASDTTGIAKGQELTGTFKPIAQTDNTDAATLQAAAKAAGAFGFTRLEGVAWDRNDGKQTTVYFADSGRKNGPSVNGRVYTLTMDPSDPTVATGFKVLLDGDAGDDVRNPAGLNNSKVELIIGESLKGYHQTIDGTNARLLVYSLATGELKTLATVDQSEGEGLLDPGFTAGTWDPVGLTNGGDIFGHGSWAVAVKTNNKDVEQFGGVDEGGQVLVLRLPAPK